jgi:RNA-directed DNA polymerase
MSNTQNNTFVSTTSNITNWSSIDWKKAEKYVDKIQKRIYRAESEGDYRKVRDLQRLLGRSAYLTIVHTTLVNQIILRIDNCIILQFQIKVCLSPL